MTDQHEHDERAQRVAAMLRAAARSERAPESLRAQVAAARAATRRAAPSRQAPAGRVPARVALRVVSFGSPAVAAIVVALVLVLGGGAGAPSIAQAASLGARAPAQPAPVPDPAAPAKLLSARVGSLHFPNWRHDGGWHSVGRRLDQLGNRTVTTVYYQLGRRRIAYSIVSAPALAGLATAGHRAAGEQYATIWQHGRTVVVWEQRDHTCLLSGTGISAAGLWQLASSSLND